MKRRVLFGSLVCAALGCERSAPASAALATPPTPTPVATPPTPTLVATPVATPVAPVSTAFSPRPSSAPPDRLVGTFTGERLRLTLTGRGETRGGTLSIRGRSFPLAARRVGDRLEGGFTVDGKTFPFTARARPGGLDLTADGRTYRLARPAGVDPWAGRFQSDDRGSLLVLERTEAALRGRIEADGARFALIGSVRDDRARGTLTDRRTGRDLAFNATRARDRLTFVVQTRSGERTSLRTLIFQRR